jgi:anti-sigma28 factor (negative regulator of flagellin synthesis)
MDTTTNSTPTSSRSSEEAKKASADAAMQAAVSAAKAAASAMSVEENQLTKTSSSELRHKRFNTLKKFVHEMASFFQDDMALKLYNHLLRKTNIKHRAPVSRHLQIFTEFCKNNRKQILSSNTAFQQTKLEYSKRVYIDFSKIFKDIEDGDEGPETQSVLFDHLLVLSMVFDPEGQANKVLKEKAGDEANDEIKHLFGSNPFLAEMMEKVEGHVKPGTNPMEAMSSMVSSGLLEELVGGMQQKIQSGEVDMDQLMGSVQRITSSLPPEQMQAIAPMLSMAGK